MTVHLTNTLTGKKEALDPLNPPEVRMYVCGLTPYDHMHIGHARTYVAFDVIRRWLEYRDFRVRFVQNVTDVEDKIIQRARENGEEPLALADRFQKEAEELLARLGVGRAESYPKVSDNIDGIIRMTEQLIEKGYAYPTKDEHGTSVYFAVRKDADYGKLSRRNLEELLEGVRKDVAEGKRDALDFALWKSAKPGELAWDSPWGKGRPGWHIECSVMATEAFGPTLDIHGGGLDLIFPHHENEVAQAESATGVEPFVRHWMHTGFLTVEGEKMSKSLGNFITLEAALTEWRPEVIRLWLAGTHYRSPIDYSELGLAQAAKNVERVWNLHHALVQAVNDARTGGLADGDKELLGRLSGDGEPKESVARAFADAMDDDFNTPLALAAVFEGVRLVNSYLSAPPEGAPHANVVAAANVWLSDALHVFGIGAPQSGVEASADAATVASLVDLLLEMRQEARARKDYAQSDKIRDRLAEIGFVIEDSPKGAKWRRK